MWFIWEYAHVLYGHNYKYKHIYILGIIFMKKSLLALAVVFAASSATASAATVYDCEFQRSLN